MTTYFVSAEIGSNSNQGTIVTAPLATLQAAAGLVKAGDTVEVMNGTYTGSPGGDVLQITTSGTAGAPITFEAMPGQTPVINSSGDWDAILDEASYTIIQGFTVVGDAASITKAQDTPSNSVNNPDDAGNGIYIGAPNGTIVPNHITIQNNIVYDEPGGGVGSQGADYIQVLNNTVYDNAHWSGYANSGISIGSSVNLDTNPGVHETISGNTVYDNTELVGNYYDNGVITDGEGIILDTNTGYTGEILVQSNTAYGNSGAGIEAYRTNNVIINGNTAYSNLTNPAAAGDGQIFLNQSNNDTVTNNTTVAPGPPAVTEALVKDTGSSSTDGITSDDALTGTGADNAVVTLTEGATTLGTTTANASGVWTYTPVTLPQGVNTVVASETVAGNTGSASLTFTYDTVPPAVTEALVKDTGSSSTDGITSDDALTGGGDSNAVVTLTKGSTTLGTTTANASGLWTFTPVTLAQGSNTIVASETDVAGNTGSASLTFTYDTVPPAVTEALVDDTGGSATSDDALTGGGDPNVVVTLTEGATKLGTTTANSSGVWTFTPAALAQGSNTIVASETDVAGNTGSASLTFTYDTVPPALTEVLVKDTGSSSTDGITSDDALTGTGADNALVTLTEGSTNLGTTTASASGMWTFTPVGLAQGVNTVVAKEIVAGNTSSASLTFTYDTVPPAVTEALVKDTGSSSTDGITSDDVLTGGGDPNVVVTLTEGATTLGTTTANASGLWTFTPATSPQGVNTVVASETDLAGNTGSASLTFTYDTVPPAVTEALVDDTGASATSDDALTGGGDPNAVVTLTEGATTLGSTTANASGVWTLTPAALAQGTDTIVASETDVAGNTGSASLTFTYDPNVPMIAGPTPTTSTLSTLEGSAGGLSAKTSVATFTATGGLANDVYAFTLSGTGAGAFTIGTSGRTATVSTGSQTVGPASGGGAKLYALNVSATDITSGTTSEPMPLDIAVASGAGDTINLCSGTSNLGITATTPAFIYALGRGEKLNATGMTAPVWLAGGPGDTMTGGTGVNDYLFDATTVSPTSAPDVITNFHALTDLIDLTGLFTKLTVDGLVSTTLAPDSVGWKISGSGTSTRLYVNTSAQAENLSSANMEIKLSGSIALSSSNIVHL